MKRRLPHALVFLAAGILVGGCSQPVEDDAESGALAHSVEETTAPRVFAFDPADFDFNQDHDWSMDDWSKADVDVLERTEAGARWRPAKVDDHPSRASGIVDQVRGGLGSGPCRLRLKLREVGFRCKWEF